MTSLSIVILAAGRGKRMYSDLPKVLHRLGGVPLVGHALAAGRSLDPEEVIVVAGHGADLVEKAQMYKNCAISIGGEVAPEARVAIAQAANDLLRIQGVDASFVAVQVGNGVNVSARSMGAVNVQVIMESLGGGGHQTMAAAQLKHITPQAARSRIQDAIDQYYLSQKKTTPEARPAKGE